MKKILIGLSVAGTVLGCNEHSKHINETAPSANAIHEHTEKATLLLLNNGIKWKADSTTIANVTSLQNIISNNKKENLEDYLIASTALQNGLNKMVAECTMQGNDHNALHVWLEPLLEKTKALGKATALENASSILQQLETQVNLFPQYFQK